MSQLENDRQSYINYIEEVSKICELGFILNEMPRIRTFTLKRLDELSIHIEEIYHGHLSDIGYNKFIKEIEEFGSEYILKKLRLLE